MSSTTSSYSSMLDGMWGPEGSDINERLKRLQNLEKMRKEREEKRQAMFGDNSGRGKVEIVKTSRLRSTNKENDGPGETSIRRAMSLNEDSGYGGARPKLGSYKANTDVSTNSGSSIFADVKAEILGSIKARQVGQYQSRSRYGSTESDDSNYGSSNTRSKYDFSRSQDQSADEEDTTKIDAIFSKYADRKPYSRRYGNDTNQNDQTAEYTTEEYTNGQEANNQFINEHQEELHEDDEEPKHFIERLKQGNHENNGFSGRFNGGQNSAFILNTIPTIPPYQASEEPADLPELVKPQDDIVSVAKEINATFGVKSPGLTPKKTPSKNRTSTSRTKTNKTPSKRKSSKKMAPEVPPKPAKSEKPVDNGMSTNLDASVTYEIHAVDYDSSGDEEGKLLPVRQSFYNSRPSEWGVVANTPGKIDQVHEFFNGDDISGEPCIRGVLDGETLRKELERSFSEDAVKTERSFSEEPVKTPARPKTPVSAKKSTQKEKVNGRRSKSPLDRLKNSVMRSSESENESVCTSGSESEAKLIGKKTRKTSSTSNSENKKDLSIGDKLAKLESMTQEKKRKLSIGEKDDLRPVPSYMSGTKASKQKKSNNKEDGTPTATPAATPSRDLKKDVRELKQFVRENSVPSTPVDSPVKSFSNLYGTPKTELISTREICVQTEFVLDFPDINYVCKHCGKSSFDDVVSSPLTVENLNKNEKKLNGKKETKPSENKFSSKDSVKSLGDTSTKSEKTRYIKKTAPSAHSYMKGTTSSRLKNSGAPSESERARKGSAPDLIHRMEQMTGSNVKGGQLKGTVSQKTKVFENKTNRAKSSERKTVDDRRQNLRKSKSVEQVSAAMNGLSVAPVDGDDLETTLTGSETVKSEQTTPTSTVSSSGSRKVSSSSNQSDRHSEEDHGEPEVTQPTVNPPVEVEKLDLSNLETPQSPSLKKPPVPSPRPKEIVASPRVENEADDDGVVVESKGQFTSIGDNPFIKSDGSKRTRTRSREKSCESVWEKAESRSRESSLKRSNSSSTRDRPNSASSLRRHNTSAGEKSSVSELTWSDSGSTESLSKGSKSSHHGSNMSLNRECDRSPVHRARTASTSSATSQNSMLNLLSPMSSTRHPVSGAIETDIDAVYNEHVKESKPNGVNNAHNEDSVNKAHLEFAKNACNVLEFEAKKRDSSNESDKATKTINNNNEVKVNDSVVAVKDVIDNSQTTTAPDVKISKKEKSKKGFLKGKLFKK